MTKEVLNPYFSDLCKVKYYAEETLVGTLIKAGTSSLSSPDLLETDLKYEQRKLEFCSPQILDHLVESDKVMINSEGLGGIEKYLLTLFPSVIPGDVVDSGTSYFSTNIDSVGDETMCLLVPEDVTQVWMFDVGDDDETCSVKVIFETGEVEFSKALYLITSYSPNSPRIVNLSYMAFRQDKNGNRKMSDYLLRNNSWVSGVKGYHEKSGFVFSDISSSVIGTEKVVNRPLYNLVKGYVGDDWNRGKRYSIGDRARVGNNVYESLEPNNIGNHPYYSRMWIKAENV